MKRLLIPAALLALSCGLVSSDVTQLKLRFPAKDFSVDTAAWHLAAVQTVPQVSCALVSCAAAASQLCSGGCTADCDDGTGFCQAHVPLALANDYDLAKEAPEFKTLADQPVLSVTVDDIYFDITQNSLTVATPVLQVIMGPQSLSSPSDPGAELVGTIPALAAGQTGRVNVTFAAGGQAVLAKYMNNFKTPCRILVAGDVLVKAGQPTPAGKLVGAVQADAHVALGK